MFDNMTPEEVEEFLEAYYRYKEEENKPKKRSFFSRIINLFNKE